MLEQGVQRDRVEAAACREKHEFGGEPPEVGEFEEFPDGIKRMNVFRGMGPGQRGEKQVEREKGHQDQRRGNERHHGAAASDGLAEHGSDGDARREKQIEDRDEMRCRVQKILAEPRQQRDVKRGRHPERGKPDHAVRQDPVPEHGPQDVPRRADQVRVDAERGGFRFHVRDEECAEEAEDGQEQDDRAGHEPAVLDGDQVVAEDRAEDDRDVGPGVHIGVSAQEFAFLQHLRDVGVFERAEQRGLRAHEEQQGKERPDAAPDECEKDRDHENELHDLACAEKLVARELVGQLAGGGGEREIREHEERHGRKGQGVRHAGRESGLIGDHDDQRVAEEVVVERAEEKGQEERKESA